MKKKLLSLVVIICIFISFAGCSEILINDKDTGKINKIELLNEFENGTYYIFNKHYNNEGYAAYMIITVKNNIITKIDFNYINNKSKIRYNDKSTEKILFFIKNLNTSVISSQNIPQSDQTIYNDIYKDYTALLSEAMPIMLNGNNNILYVSTEMSYSAVINKYDEEGYNKKLSITIKDDLITEIKFIEQNKDDEDKKDHNIYNSRFRKEYSIKYSDYIQNMITPSIGKKEIIKSKDNLDIDKNFNSLAKYLNKKLVYFDYTKINKFKNI